MNATPKKTLVLGASDNPERYSYQAIVLLRRFGHPVFGIGKKKCQVADVGIEEHPATYTAIDTVTIYLNPIHQRPYYDLIVNTHPARVIFNPGTENPELEELLEKNKIPYLEACTLVMLQTHQY
jgi:predicted CoA-binding protein